MYQRTALIVVALAAIGAASNALAQVQPATQDSQAAPQGPVSTASASDTDRHIAELLQDPDTASARGRASDRDGQDDADGPPDRAIHGEVGFGVGTHGYREAYGVATMPLGQHGSVTVAVDDSQMRVRGYNTHGRNLAIDLALGDAARPSPAAACARPVRSDSDQYAPLWTPLGDPRQTRPSVRPCP